MDDKGFEDDNDEGEAESEKKGTVPKRLTSPQNTKNDDSGSATEDDQPSNNPRPVEVTSGVCDSDSETEDEMPLAKKTKV